MVRGLRVMNKNEFMESLKEKLSKLSVEDREDAINYYWEYFEEAGFGEESDVTKNVGNPEDVAAKIIETAECLRESGLQEKSSCNKNEWENVVNENKTECNTDISKERKETEEIKEESDSAKTEKSENYPVEITALDIFGNDKQDAFDSIDIDISNLDVILRTGDEFGISINCKDEGPIIERVGTCLVIKDRSKAKFIKIFDFNFNIFNREKGFIEIIIPRDKKLNKIKSRLELGKFYLFALTADEMDVRTDMGSLELVSATAPKCKLGAVMGHISVKDSAFNELKVRSDTGAVNIKYTKTDFLKISTDTGYISLEKTDAGNTELKSDTGYIKLYSGNAGSVSAKTDTGLIKFDGTELNSLEAKSDTGSISAKLIGVRENYKFDLKNNLGIITVDGKNQGKSIFDNRYTDNTGEIPVRMSVDTGKISVSFLGK